MKLLIIDLFAGAGGVSTGFESAQDCKVIAAINHDEIAIASHEANHPDVIHFVEDIRHIQMEQLQVIALEAQLKYPKAKLLLWASLECTNFSKAKGGKPRDADSRSLADFMPWYVESLNPDYVGIENVVEFMSWGPLDEHDKPISRKQGSDYLRWVEEMKALGVGYEYDWRALNSADFGAYTSRKRFFAYFAKKGLPISWPVATHSKNGDLLLSPWKAVREVLDLEDKGRSIFDRPKPLSENTLKRIYSGLLKFVSGKGEADFLASYYGNGHNCTSIDSPGPTLRTKDSAGIIQPRFIYRDFGQETNSSIETPSGSITGSPKLNLVTCFIVNPQWFNTNAGSVDQPCSTIIARMDKAPLYLVQLEKGVFGIQIYETDSEMVKKIKQFMAMHGIYDITMRMFRIDELLRVQGFPRRYILKGNQTQQKKFIGNSVVPIVVTRMAEELVRSNF